jgi:hypothetical protein
MDKGESVIASGNVEFALQYRNDIPGDEGLCIQIYAPVSGADTELLRFDCFATAPHYHYGPEADDERLMFDATASGDPLDWTLECFGRGRLEAMIRRAGYASVADELDEKLVRSVLPSVEERARTLVAKHSS